MQWLATTMSHGANQSGALLVSASILDRVLSSGCKMFTI